ncbi:hypothetical protein H6P81_014406 [Aristolochia fimbriata]|uniref:Zinc finger CCCH domain-containing protein 13-like n=1 Tax=Aristolochia fimbriata TaxID=158543 RepID=A0AAV7EM07_ARIFI|nr:hypothetical protein H6P81_014406 [Aristolochia fimbriata]
MPRSSRHKSHKQHKYSSKDARDYSDSDEEEVLKERKAREGPAVSSGIRVLKDSDSNEKRKVKDLLGPGNGDYSGEYGSSKRRKDRADSTVGSDRWNGGDDERVEGSEDKEMKNDGFGLEVVSASKSKMTIDSRSKSSRRLESGSDRREESLVSSLDNEEAKKGSAKVDSKRKSEKEGSRKEWLQYKDVREKERGPERDKKGQDGRREKSVDILGTNEVCMKQSTQMGDEEIYYKKEVENTESPIYAEVCSPELENDYEKRVRKRSDGSGTKDVKDDEDDVRRLSREDRQRNGKYKDEKHKDDRYKDKHREDSERDHRYKDDKYRDERSSRDHTADRPDSKYSRDESKNSESRHKKAKLQDNNSEVSPHTDDQSNRYKDYNGRKRSPDDNEDLDDVKTLGAKELRSDVEKNASANSKLDSPGERRRSKSRSHHSEAVDSGPSSNRERNSPCSGTQTGKDMDRHESKQSESVHRDALSSERYRRSSTREAFEKASDSQYLERSKQKTDSYSGELSAENVVGSQYDRSPKSVRQVSPVRLAEKSPSSTSGDRRYSNRTSGRRSLDIEELGRRSSGSRDLREYSINDDRGQEFPFEKSTGDDFTQAESHRRESTPASSSFNRTSAISSNSPGVLPPPPPFRHGLDSPSVMGSSEDDSRGPASDRRMNRYKRTGDSSSIGRGQGNNAWKGVPNWPPPVTNGFLPFQHGPPASGFHPVVQQFPSPLFGVRPSLELNHAGVPWHDPGRPFGWQNPADESAPHLHGWDGNTGVFGEESHIYARPDWDPSRQSMGNRGWDISTDLWKGQNGNVNMEYPTCPKEGDYTGRAPVDEMWTAGQSGQRARNERNRPERLPAESIEIKRSGNTPSAKKATESGSSVVKEKTPEPPKLSKLEEEPSFCRVYLSKLDISVDLTSPELHKQCMDLMGMEDLSTGINTTNDVLKKDTRDLRSMCCVNNLRALLFPESTETIFEMSMALYKKQKEEMQMKKRPIVSVPDAAVNKPSPTGDEEEAEGIEDSEKVDKIAKLAPSDENKEADSFVSRKEHECDSLSGVVISDGSQACEASKPELVECRVNLSRIPNSPESTH